MEISVDAVMAASAVCVGCWAGVVTRFLLPDRACMALTAESSGA